MQVPCGELSNQMGSLVDDDTIYVGSDLHFGRHDLRRRLGRTPTTYLIANVEDVTTILEAMRSWTVTNPQV